MELWNFLFIGPFERKHSKPFGIVMSNESIRPFILFIKPILDNLQHNTQNKSTTINVLGVVLVATKRVINI